MVYVLAAGALVCAWTVLRILGAERERRIELARTQIESQRTPPPSAT